MWDVLEHLPDPMLILEQIKSHLDSEGIFCFSTLDIDNWFPKLTGKNWPWIMDMHLFYFSRRTTEQLLAQANLKVLAVKIWCHYISIQYFF